MSFPGRSRARKRGNKVRSSLRIPSATVISSGLLLSTGAVYAAENEPQAEPIRVAEANTNTGVEAGTDQVLATVVVQARNKLEPLKDVPLSISVVQGNELQRLQAEDLGAITRRAANVSWNQ